MFRMMSWLRFALIPYVSGSVCSKKATEGRQKENCENKGKLTKIRKKTEKNETLIFALRGA